MADLLDSIEWRAVECLNANPAHGVENALKQGYRDDMGIVLQSDTDEQLLIQIPFQQAVKLQSVTIASNDGDQAPRRVKLFINRASLGFSEAADFAATQEFELTEQQLGGEPVQLKYVKFQAVNHLSIFVEDNQGDEEVTRVGKIQLLGAAGQTMNVAEIKKVEEGQ
jgi:hypothetical protein